jgi:hypothetical protein
VAVGDDTAQWQEGDSITSQHGDPVGGSRRVHDQHQTGAKYEYDDGDDQDYPPYTVTSIPSFHLDLRVGFFGMPFWDTETGRRWARKLSDRND